MIPKFRCWFKPENTMREVTTMEFTSGKLCYICFDYEESGYGPDKCVLMQSTGIFDKNGVEIFEGDVVEFEDATYAAGDIDVFLNIGYVEINQGMFNITNRVYVNIEDLLDGSTWGVEVIGNIYENPELVEVENA